MIECGWCGRATAPDRCSECGRDPVLPWAQRAQDPPLAHDREAGRPTLNAGQIGHKVRLARRDLGDSATNAQLAEHLGISERTLNRWQKLSA